MQNEYQRESRHHEWLLTNRIGGYALGYGNFINQRKYDGLLIASQEGFRRVHLLSSLEERIEWVGQVSYLDSSSYPNCIFPNGHEHLVKSWLRPYPSGLYSSVPFSEEYVLFKEIFMVQGKNGVIIKYTNLGASAITLVLRPKFTLRDHHCVNPSGIWERVPLVVDLQERSCRVQREDTGVEAFVYADGGELTQENVVYRNVYYPLEASRGYDGGEDLWAPVTLRVPLCKGASVRLIVSGEPLQTPLKEADRSEEFYKDFPLPKDHPRKNPGKRNPFDGLLNDEDLYSLADYRKILQMAARDFVVGDDIIAGYPWFGPWGRDTLICLSGLSLVEQGDSMIRRILLKYGREIKEGLLPNTFGEGGAGLNYDTVDAPLWFVLRVYEYHRRNPLDVELFQETLKVVFSYLFNPSLKFFVGEDGLVEIREGDHALTWMDAKIYGRPVTPRQGKPIEINALWYNALRATLWSAEKIKMKRLEVKNHALTLSELRNLVEKVHGSLRLFMGEETLADRIDRDVPIFEFRPNALIALSLPFDFLEEEEMAKVFRKAQEELLTPYGLRSLSFRHPAFKKRYLGNEKQRDMAYHQGTVWAFLLLPFVKLYLKLYRRKKSPVELRREISGWIWRLRNGFLKGHIASVAEVWDGEDPHFPKGAPAQGWSVFALLEIEEILQKL